MSIAPAPLEAEVIAHHLRICGVSASALDLDGRGSRAGKVRLAIGPTAAESDHLRGMAAQGNVVLAVLPQPSFLAQFQIAGSPAKDDKEAFALIDGGFLRDANPRSLCPVRTFAHPKGVPLVCNKAAQPIWLKVPVGDGQIVVIGSDLATDLTRYRQGNPNQASDKPTEALWGIAGERPNYLFDAQVPEGHEHDRPADWWAMALARVVSDCLGEPLRPMLPNAAPGAIVITGDDDQAYLEKYQEQLELLNGLPITYFLHPLTRHTPETLAAMGRHHQVELGLHPDALEQPDRYAELYREQATWFRALTGRPARLVRNHGFLNDGYWGHLPVWLEQSVLASSNLPGLDGKVLNGSLLPARMVWNGQLTSHWSILTAIGDGVRFALGLNGPQSAQCIRDMADRILGSKLPGVIVLNLHPQNVAETREMHLVLHELVREGFIAMTLGQCIDWFEARDRGEVGAYEAPSERNFFRRIFGTLAGRGNVLKKTAA